MNIFILATEPERAAEYHCDQHLHKMILESAQMLSTHAFTFLPLDTWRKYEKYFYIPTHLRHPCNLWLDIDTSHRSFLLRLVHSLNSIREGLGSSPHKSLDVIKAYEDIIHSSQYLPGISEEYNYPKNGFIFAGPTFIGNDSRIPTIWDKYHEYYKLKAKLWAALDKRARMSYKWRPIPYFLTGDSNVIH